MTLTREEMMNWLEQWLKISQNIDSKLILIQWKLDFILMNC